MAAATARAIVPWLEDRTPLASRRLASATAPIEGTDEDAAAFLRETGERLRLARARRGMTRRRLADQSGVSERYIAQMEAGSGNVSILVLRALGRGLGIAATDLLQDRPDMLEGLLGRLSAPQLAEARSLLLERFGTGRAARRRRIALIGMRGAGKSTIGRMLAEFRGVPFLELDGEIEQEAGMSLATIFELHGQSGYRRLERRALERLIAEPDAVIAAGGSIVAEAATYDLLLSYCRAVWIMATPEEHMRRVLDQGDLRPMQDSRQAMRDLRAILASREALYARADLVLDTSGKSATQSFLELIELLKLEEPPAR